MASKKNSSFFHWSEETFKGNRKTKKPAVSERKSSNMVPKAEESKLSKIIVQNSSDNEKTDVEGHNLQTLNF